MTEQLIYTCDACGLKGDDAVDTTAESDLFGDLQIEHLCETCFIQLCEVVQTWLRSQS